MRAERAIGIFDSGVGGLTVFKVIRKDLPRERLIYYGDTAHLPYGTKSPRAIRAFSLAIARFLERQGIKILVVACHSASSVAIPLLRKSLRVPVLGVIEPGALAASRVTRKGRVGVIGTEATIASRAYPRAIRHLGKHLRVSVAACPLFVPLVEEGFWNGRLAREAARRYLAPLKRWRPDTLVLGCTHYPLLKPVIAETLGRRVVLVDSAQVLAAQVRLVLAKSRLLKGRGCGGCRFYVSDAPRRFKKLAQRLLGVSAPHVVLKRFD